MASLADSPLTEEEYLRIERLAETKSESGCCTYNADLRIKAARAGLYTYADCSVICGELQYAADQKDVVVNPILIVEVLSPSTEGYDRGRKFELYRTIPSFREYLLIAQDERYVEHYSKQDSGGWLLREYRSGIITIPCLQQLRIALDELYESVVN